MKTMFWGAVLGMMAAVLVGCTGEPVDAFATGASSPGAEADAAVKPSSSIESCSVEDDVSPTVTRKLAVHAYPGLDAEEIAARVTAAGMLGGTANKIAAPAGAAIATGIQIFAEDGVAKARCDMMTGAGPVPLFFGVQFTLH